MGCIPSKNQVLEADSSVPVAIKTKTKKEKKQKRSLESPIVGEDGHLGSTDQVGCCQRRTG